MPTDVLGVGLDHRVGRDDSCWLVRVGSVIAEAEAERMAGLRFGRWPSGGCCARDRFLAKLVAPTALDGRYWVFEIVVVSDALLLLVIMLVSVCRPLRGQARHHLLFVHRVGWGSETAESGDDSVSDCEVRVTSELFELINDSDCEVRSGNARDSVYVGH